MRRQILLLTRTSLSLSLLLGVTVKAIEMATPSAPWIAGEVVTETWISKSSDPDSFALVMNGNGAKTLLIEELVATSLGAYTFAVPNITGYVIRQ